MILRNMETTMTKLAVWLVRLLFVILCAWPPFVPSAMADPDVLATSNLKAPGHGGDATRCGPLCRREPLDTGTGRTASVGGSDAGGQSRLLDIPQQVTVSQLAPATPPGETQRRFVLVFRGFSTQERRGIEEYLVEFPGYQKHRLVKDRLEHREYHYETNAGKAQLSSDLAKMLAFLDLPSRVAFDAGRFQVRNIAVDTPPTANSPSGIALRLSSVRGRDPTYRIGETLDLLIELDRDAWLYCFYLQVDGRLIKLFPNIHHRVARLVGGQQHKVPGALYPFDLDIVEPPGTELLTCFATTRNVEADLPVDLRRMEIAPLPEDVALGVAEIFRNIPDVGMTEASLTITVTR